MIIILTEGTTPRHRYIFSYLFHTYCGMECRFADASSLETIPSGSPVLSYLNSAITGSFHIKPCGILSSTGIPQEPGVVDCSGTSPFFYPCQGADFHFDIFGAAFYLLSRAEEYQGHPRDAFGRYHHIHSLAFRNGWLDLPLIDIWMGDFREALIRKFPSLAISPPVFEFHPSYDVDIAWAFRARGWYRTIWGISKSLIRGKLRNVINRMDVIRGAKPDPYDSYDRLGHLHAEHGLKPVFFLLMASRLKGVDRNPDPERKDFQKLVGRLANKHLICMHPSWQSGDDPNIFRAEKERLERVIGRRVTSSRQHYLRMHLPDTYRRLISEGITDDHSMGYGTINGFRASVSRPFPWYDLQEEQETNLMVHPFCFMDATAYHEQGLAPEDAVYQLESYLKVIGHAGGCMSTIFHNSMLGTDPMYKGWYEMYVRFLQQVAAVPSSFHFATR
jgi:hypothetical protein